MQEINFMKLSIVIPIYNVADTLVQCLDSVMAEPLDGCELLLVDDGSRDASGSLADGYAARYGNVTVFHTPNQGLSAARNLGLAHAQGEYVTFIDSDDFLKPGTLGELMDILESHPDYDVLEYPVSRLAGKNAVVSYMPEEGVCGDAVSYWLKGQAYCHAYACNKLVRRSLFREVSFPVGRVFEDVYTLPLILCQQPRVATTQKGMYYYRDNPNGITRKAHGTDLQDLLKWHIKAIDELGIAPSAKPEWNQYFIYMLNIQLDVMELTGCHPLLSATWNVRPANYKAWLLKLLGFRGLLKLNNLAHKWMGRRSGWLRDDDTETKQ